MEEVAESTLLIKTKDFNIPEITRTELIKHITTNTQERMAIKSKKVKVSLDVV